jgi:iron complex outermembrane recepter protein
MFTSPLYKQISFSLGLLSALVLFIITTSYASPPPEPTPPTITVTGTLAGQSFNKNFTPIIVVEKEALQSKPGSSLGDALQQEPGVTSSSFGPGASRPIIRGQGGARVRIVENGVSVGDISQTSDDHAVSFDPSLVDHVELLRGSGNLFYGGSAIGGVVNIIDSTIPFKAIGVEKEGSVQITKGDSASDLISGSALLQGQANKLNWNVSGFYTDTDDIKIPGFAESALLREQEKQEHEGETHTEGEEEEEEVRGKLISSATTTKGLKSGFSVKEDDNSYGFGFRYFNSLYGVPGHAHEEDNETEESMKKEHSEEEGTSIDLEQFRISTDNHIDNPHPAIEKVRLSGALSSYKHQELEGAEIGTRFEDFSTNLRLETLHTPLGRMQGGGGIEFLYDDFSAVGEEAFIPANRNTTPSFFITERYALTPSVDATFGGRFDSTHYNGAALPSNPSFNSVSASSGVESRLSESYLVALTASYSERAPTATELFANGVHVATRTREVGDLDLEKERSVGVEARIQKDLGTVTAEASTYLQNYSDYINAAFTGEITDELPTIEYRHSEARIWGSEGRATIALLEYSAHTLDLTGQADIVRASITASDQIGQNLPRIPPVRTLVRLAHTYRNSSSSIETQIVEPQKRTAELELPTQGFVMLNIRSAYQIPLGTNKFELFAQGTNLLDQEARLHSSFLKDVAPLRGRSFSAGLKVLF